MNRLPKRGFDYYLGLFFLILSCGSIVWCIAKENFQLIHFLAFLVFFSWGFGLLWKSDSDLRFAFTEGEMENMRNLLKELQADAARMSQLLEGPAAHETEPESESPESDAVEMAENGQFVPDSDSAAIAEPLAEEPAATKETLA